MSEWRVLDWRKKAETRDSARVLVKDVPDELPDVYDPDTWQRKSDAVFDHIFASYYDDGGSVYDDTDGRRQAAVAVVTAPAVTASSTVIDVTEITPAVLERIASSPALAERVAELPMVTHPSSRGSSSSRTMTSTARRENGVIAAAAWRA